MVNTVYNYTIDRNKQANQDKKNAKHTGNISENVSINRVCIYQTSAFEQTAKTDSEIRLKVLEKKLWNEISKACCSDIRKNEVRTTRRKVAASEAT